MKVVVVRGLKEYRVGGKLYRYHRLSKTRISSDLKGAALAAEVDRLDRLYKPLQAAAGTLRLLIIEYKAHSEHWAGLRARTRKDYERVFTLLGPALDNRLTSFTPPVLVAMRDKAKKAHGFKFANQMLVALKMIFAYGVEYDHCKVNPVKDVTPATRPADLPDANRPWEPQETAKTIPALGYPVKAPTAVAAYLGLREGDILALSLNAYRDGLIKLTTSKTRRALELPVCEDLAAIIDESLRERAAYFARMKRADTSTTLFVTSRGKPWTIDGFKTSFGKARDALMKAKVIGAGCTFHGLRHGVATILADEGFEDNQTKHLLGHGVESITEHYSRRAKRRKMLTDMTEAIQRVYREAARAVVPFDRKQNRIV
jgi:integrase